MVDIAAMREELGALRDRNLDEATFEDKLDNVFKLDIKVYPSEDLKSMKVLCQLNLEQVQSNRHVAKVESTNSQADGECESAVKCRKVMFGPPSGMIDRTLSCGRAKGQRWMLSVTQIALRLLLRSDS